MFCAATTSTCKNFFSSSPLAILPHAHFKQLDETPLPMHEKEARCSFFLFFHSPLSRLHAFFSFFSKTQRSSSFFRHTNFPLFLSKMNNAKEFTNEERSLLKFQKKQQHGQVFLFLFLLLVVVFL